MVIVTVVWKDRSECFPTELLYCINNKKYSAYTFKMLEFFQHFHSYLTESSTCDLGSVSVTSAELDRSPLVQLTFCRLE